MTDRTAHRFAAVDVHYPAAGGARAAVVVAAVPTFATIVAEHTVTLAQAEPYRPGAFYLRELPPLLAVLADAGLAPAGRTADDPDDPEGAGTADAATEDAEPPEAPPRLALLVVDGYIQLDPAGRPGLGAHVHAELGVPVVGVAKTAFRAATHAVEVVRGGSARPLLVTSTGLPVADAADLVRAMAGPHRLPDALRRVDGLARGTAHPR